MSSPKWRGVNHLALVTSNMDDTVRFYAGVLGARLVATVGTPSFRHYFFDFGTNSTLAFFEYTDVEPDAYAKPPACRFPRRRSSTTSRSTSSTRSAARPAPPAEGREL